VKSIKITVEYEDGLVGVFERQPDDTWHQTGLDAHLRITDYDGPNVMRVLANGIGTREVAE
jgi:hypothetical protein